MSELSEALEAVSQLFNPDFDDYTVVLNSNDAATIFAAARRQLALEPDKCGTCGGSGDCVYTDSVSLEKVHHPCPTCHGRGWQYKPETVEAVMDAALIPEPLAVAVLDALRSLDQEAPR